jgi:hypothetical protein
MRMAGRFARRVKAWGQANDVPVIYCKARERKHLIASEFLASHQVGAGVFLVLVAKAPATVFKVRRSSRGRIVTSRNLLFAYGGQMDRVFSAMLDRTRSRLDIPALRTLFGTRSRPRKYGTAPSPRVGVALETPAWDLTVFKVHFGLLTLKGYTKGARTLRFEAITHNTRQLGCGRTLERFPQIVARLAGMCQRFCTALDCVDIGFLPDGTLDQLPLPGQAGASRVGGIDVNKPRIRAALAAVLALAASPDGFTVADMTAKVHAMTGQAHATCNTRQAAYDLRKLRGKQLVSKPARTRRYYLPAQAARTISALLTLRDHVIAPSWPASGSAATTTSRPG